MIVLALVKSLKRLRPLGTLEQQVMDVLWDQSPLAVRAVMQKLSGSPSLAYTTVMTTLDRLHKKGLLLRTKDGIAFVYRPALSRDDHQRGLIESAVTDLLSSSATPVLSAFVDAAVRADASHLDELERLIAEHRKTKR